MSDVFHIICAGPSTRPYLAMDTWLKKSVILCNGMPLLWTARCEDLRWVMIDPIPEGLKSWTQNPCENTRYCTDLNKHDVLGGTVIRHNHVHVMDNPEVAGFFWHGSVGQLACHLAWWLGAKRCMVWGLDYHDKRRSYDRLHQSMSSPDKFWDHMDVVEGGWQKLVTGLHDLGCEVFNANPGTALKAVPLIDVREALKE